MFVFNVKKIYISNSGLFLLENVYLLFYLFFYLFIILSVLFIIIFIKSNGYVKFNYAKKLFAIFSFYFCNLLLRLNPITLDDVTDDASNNPNNNSNKTNNSNETKDNSNNNNKVEAYANAKKVVKDAIDAIGKVVESGLG